LSTAPSLYRRHRPRTFADVVGQEHVVRTLRNAVSQGKVHHAYLFVGSRGTGKTSMAKILAACLNCAGPPGKPTDGPTIEPCGVCESCVAIANATSLDVIEMDAASNNSVDDVRDLREKVAFAPVSGRHKVYILDEAHMLSTAAWNAFLKTLEEPPPHTIFVLATTEANKVPATVVDRCHRFDFGRPTVEQLAAVVRRVAEREGIEIPPDAVALLARHAAGSFRDALGTLEQLVTYSGNRIELGDVLAVLGVADSDLLFGVLDAVAAHDAKAVLLTIAQVAESGRDLSRFAADVESHARELLVVQTLGEVPAEIAVTAERDARLAEQAARVAGNDVVRVLDLLAAGLRAVKDGADARTQLELALVKAAAPEVDASARGLLARVARLEEALAGRAAPEASAATPAPAAATAAGRGEAGKASADKLPKAPPSTPAAAAKPTRAAAAVAPAAAAPAPAVAAVQPGAAGAVAVALAAPALDLAGLLDLWPAVLESLAESNQVLALCLHDARPVALSADDLTVAFDAGAAFMRRKAEDPRNRAALAETIRALTGLRVRLAFELREGLTAQDGATTGPAPTEDELIARFKAEFDAEEIDPGSREDAS
jgi:DNA polymerase-3 subunit gamma/tau